MGVVCASFSLPSLLPCFSLSHLPKHPVLVPNPIPPRRQVQRRHGVQEAGGEAAEAAVAERGVALVLDHVFEAVPHLRQSFRVFRRHGQAVEGVGEGAPHEELHGQVVDAAQCVWVGEGGAWWGRVA